MVPLVVPEIVLQLHVADHMTFIYFFPQVQVKSQMYVYYVHVDPPTLSGLGLFVIRRILLVNVSIFSFQRLIIDCYSIYLLTNCTIIINCIF